MLGQRQRQKPTASSIPLLVWCHEKSKQERNTTANVCAQEAWNEEEKTRRKRLSHISHGGRQIINELTQYAIHPISLSFARSSLNIIELVWWACEGVASPNLQIICILLGARGAACYSLHVYSPVDAHNSRGINHIGRFFEDIYGWWGGIRIMFIINSFGKTLTLSLYRMTQHQCDEERSGEGGGRELDTSNETKRQQIVSDIGSVGLYDEIDGTKFLPSLSPFAFALVKRRVETIILERCRLSVMAWRLRQLAHYGFGWSSKSRFELMSSALAMAKVCRFMHTKAEINDCRVTSAVHPGPGVDLCCYRDGLRQRRQCNIL